MTAKTRAVLKSDKNITLATNSTGAITAAVLRAEVDHIADSTVFPEDISADLAKLAGIETAATADQTGAEIKALYEAEANTNAFTDAEKSKLAGLESSKFLGTFVNLAALQSAYPSPVEGSYAHVDAGVGADAEVYIWDNDDTAYVLMAGSGTTETAASIKTKYESNPDTNAYTDAEKAKLAGVATGATANTGALADKNTVATADIDDAAVTFAKLIQAITGASIIAKATTGAGAFSELVAGTNSVLRRVGGDLGFGLLSKVHLNVRIVDNTILEFMNSQTLKGRTTAGSGAPEDLTMTQVVAMLDTHFGSTAWRTGGGATGATFHNATGGTLTKGTPIALGAFDVTSGNPGMIAADADGSGTMPCVGILSADVADGADGVPAISGQEVTGLDTSGYTLGDKLYVSTAGSLTDVRPTSGFIQPVAVVSRVDAVNGEIIVILEEAGTLFPDVHQVAASDETTALTTGTSKITFRMPFAMTLTDIRASVNTAPTGSTLIVDVKKNGTTIFSTNLSIDASAKTSVGATTPAVISVPAIADDDEISIDIVQVGSTVAGAGLKLLFKGYRS